MLFRSVIRVILVLAATVAVAQSAQPGTTASEPILNLQPPVGRRAGAVATKPTDPLTTLREQVAGMESTLAHMHVVLKQMQDQAAKSKTPDSLVKANVGMWELMLAHLDEEFQQLRAVLANREDMEARRINLYKQADAKIEAAAQARRAAEAARFAQAAQNPTGTQTPTATGQSSGQGAAAQSAPAQPSAPTTNTSSSPN